MSEENLIERLYFIESIQINPLEVNAAKIAFMPSLLEIPLVLPDNAVESEVVKAGQAALILNASSSSLPRILSSAKKLRKMNISALNAVTLTEFSSKENGKMQKSKHHTA